MRRLEVVSGRPKEGRGMPRLARRRTDGFVRIALVAMRKSNERTEFNIL